MSSTKNAQGKRVFDDFYNLPRDMQDLADDDYENLLGRAGTRAAREAFPTAQRKPGMLWSEADTGSIYRADPSDLSWQLLVEKELRPQTVNGGTVDTYGGVVPNAGNTIVRVNGVFSPRFRIYQIHFWLLMSTSDAGLGFNLTANGIPNTTTQHNTQRAVFSGTAPTTAPQTGGSGWAASGMTGANLQGVWIVRNPATYGIKSFSADSNPAPGVSFALERGWLGGAEGSTYDGFQVSASTGTFQGGFLKVLPVG